MIEHDHRRIAGIHLVGRDTRQQLVTLIMAHDHQRTAGQLCTQRFVDQYVLDRVAIGVLLIVVAVLVAIEVKALLIGQGMEPRRRDELMSFLKNRPEVAEVLNLITLQMGPDVMVAVKARMVPITSDRKLIDAINVVEAAMKAEFGDVKWSFFEPDNAD